MFFVFDCMLVGLIAVKTSLLQKSQIQGFVTSTPEGAKCSVFLVIT